MYYYFQPIFSAQTGRVHAYEALTSHVTNPVMVTGTLPYDKEKMLEGIYGMLGTGKESDLHGIVSVSDAAVER